MIVYCRAEVRGTKVTASHSMLTTNGATELADPVQVAVTDDGAGAFLLLREDQEGVAIADTWHISVEDAKEQAEMEYTLGEWRAK